MAIGNRSAPIRWETAAFDVYIQLSANEAPCLSAIVPRGEQPPVSVSDFFPSGAIPIDSARSIGDGHTGIKTPKALLGSMLSYRLRYVSHTVGQEDAWQTLDIVSIDDTTGLQITHHFAVYGAIPVLRSNATVRNTSKAAVTVTQLCSLTIGGLTTGTRSWWNEYTVLTSRNGWFSEAKWLEHTLPDLGIEKFGILELREGHRASQAQHSLSNRGSFSTGTFLPIGALRRKDGRDTWLWQVEHNGSWRWEIGDFQDSIYLSASGPTNLDHEWSVNLAPDEEFTAVTVALCHVCDSVDAAFAALTEYRRKIRRPHRDYDRMPIIFNDYMNCLMGDPNEDKVKALLKPVHEAGAEYFVLDAGWYADDSNWWDDVGLWEPSKARFPSGFDNLAVEIQKHDLILGLWLEPEVVGVRSVVGEQLPDDAFFREGGHRVVERGRFQLDYRHPAVRERMHGVIARLVGQYKVGYFKFDYNIEVMSGSDSGITSRGQSHLAHQRAYLSWVNELLDRYPGLVIENCSSGAQRMDYAMLAVHTLQSTSDQQDPALYAVIAAAVPTAVVPEQSATWAYPQRAWSDEINALTVVNSLMGRVHLSGRLDELKADQLQLVTEGMNVYKSIRHEIKGAVPFWPLGLPKWQDDWVILGLRLQARAILLSVYRRSGPVDCSIPLPLSVASFARLLYPASFPCEMDVSDHGLKLTLPAQVCARLIRIDL